MILIRDGSELSKEAEWYLKENNIRYDVLYVEFKCSFESVSMLEDIDDDEEEEEWYMECLISPFSEEGFGILLRKDLSNNVN